MFREVVWGIHRDRLSRQLCKELCKGWANRIRMSAELPKCPCRKCFALEMAGKAYRAQCELWPATIEMFGYSPVASRRIKLTASSSTEWPVLVRTMTPIRRSGTKPAKERDP